MADLKNKLSEFPISIKVPDPVTGEDLVYNRADIMKALVIDRQALAGESAIVAGQYAEAARLERACAGAAERAETSFAQWKAQRSNEVRAKKAAAEEKISEKAVEQYYRSHRDYETNANLASYYNTLSALFGDIKKAFDIKSRQIGNLTESRRGQQGVESRGAHGPAVGVAASTVEGDESLEDLEAMAAESIAKSRVAAPKKPKPAVVEDNEEEVEEEAEEVDEEDEEEVPEPPSHKRAGRPAKPKPVVVEDDEEETEEEVEEEDEEEAPPPKKRGRPAGSKNKAKPVVVEDDEEEAEEEIEEVEEDEDDEPPPPRRAPRRGK